MRRPLAISLVGPCIILGWGGSFLTEAFLFPPRPSFSRSSVDVPKPRDPAKLDSLKALKSSRRSIFAAAGRQRRDSKKVGAHVSRFAGLRRSAGVLLCAAVCWFGAAGLKTSSSHASTEVAPIPKATNQFSSSLGKMVDGYVEEHMFEDDVYDPVESVYREALADQGKGVYPKALSDVTSSILGQNGVQTEEQKAATGIGGLMLNGINLLQRRGGLSETAAIIVLTGSFVVAGPIAFLCIGMMVGAQSKRQINSVMKKRYGDTYTVDASIKVEDDIELPDEDDDDEGADDEGSDDDNGSDD